MSEASEAPPDFAKRRLAIPTPSMLADRLGLSPSVVVIGAIGIVAAFVGGWWAMRTPAAPAPELILPHVNTVSTLVPPPTTPPPAKVVVHVAGAVKEPGLHELAAGSRVADAIAAAGGITADADADRLNLAAPISDGSRLWVLAVGEEVEPSVSDAVLANSGTSGSGNITELVNINTADARELESLPGIGPSLAAAILEHRQRIGEFASVDSLLDVSGIGPAKLAQILPLATV